MSHCSASNESIQTESTQVVTLALQATQMAYTHYITGISRQHFKVACQHSCKKTWQRCLFTFYFFFIDISINDLCMMVFFFFFFFCTNKCSGFLAWTFAWLDYACQNSWGQPFFSCCWCEEFCFNHVSGSADNFCLNRTCCLFHTPSLAHCRTVLPRWQTHTGPPSHFKIWCRSNC